MTKSVTMIALFIAVVIVEHVHCLPNEGSDGGKSEPACLLQSTFASTDLSVDAAAEIHSTDEAGLARMSKMSLLYESDALEESIRQSLKIRSQTRSRSCKAHLMHLERKFKGFHEAHNVSDKSIDKVVKGFISQQSGSQDACSSQLMEAKHQLNQIHQYVSDLVVEVNHTELARLALDDDLQSQIKEMEKIEKEREEDLAECEKKKQEYIEMYSKLSAEMEEMKQIASPGVAIEWSKTKEDVKTGKVMTSEEVGLVQMRNHPNSVKDMKKLHVLIQGTQSAAQKYMTCMAHLPGHKAHISELQEEARALKGKPGKGKKGKGKGKKKKGKGEEELEEEPIEPETENEPETGGDDPKPKPEGYCFTRELWSDEKKEYCCDVMEIGCPDTEGPVPSETEIETGGPDPEPTVSVTEKPPEKTIDDFGDKAPTGSMVPDPSQDGRKCKYGEGEEHMGADRTFRIGKKFQGSPTTLEICTNQCANDPECVAFSIEYSQSGSTQWCIGCKKAVLVAKHAGAIAYKKVADDSEDVPTFNPTTISVTEKPQETTIDDFGNETPYIAVTVKPLTIPPKPTITHPDPYIKRPLVTATMKPQTFAPTSTHGDPYPARETREKQIDPAPPALDEPVVDDKGEGFDVGDLGSENGITGSGDNFGKGSSGDADVDATMSVDDLRKEQEERMKNSARDENDHATMDAAAAIKAGAATNETCEEEKKILEETYVKTYVELSRLKDEYYELANSTACEEAAESKYKSRKTPIQDKIDQLIKDIDEKVKELQGLRPRLESAIDAEAELRKHIETLTEECTQLPETVSNLDKVRDAIEALSKCPGLSRVQFSLPKWNGTWVEVKLNAKTMNDTVQDDVMDAACAQAVPGTRAAEVGEIAEQTVENIPETNTAELPLMGSCPHCTGDEAGDLASGHKRVCWKQGKDLTSKAQSTNCASGLKAILCVTDRENFRQIPGES